MNMQRIYGIRQRVLLYGLFGLLRIVRLHERFGLITLTVILPILFLPSSGSAVTFFSRIVSGLNPLQLFLAGCLAGHVVRCIAYVSHNIQQEEMRPSVALAVWLFQVADCAIWTTRAIPNGTARVTALCVMLLYFFLTPSAMKETIQYHKLNYETAKVRESMQKGRLVRVRESFLLRQSGASRTRVTADGFLPCDVIVPVGRAVERLVLYVHGGGFVALSPCDFAQLGGKLAVDTRSAVVMPEYPHAPEQPYPAGVEYVAKFLAHAIETRGAFLGLELGTTVPIVVMGDSAGGNLVLCALLRTAVQPSAAVLIYPVTSMEWKMWNCPGKRKAIDRALGVANIFSAPHAQTQPGRMSASRQSSRFRATRDPFIDFNMIIGMIGDYLRSYDGDDPGTDPMMSPIAADDEAFKRLPQLYVQVGTMDPLLDDAALFVDKALSAGCRIKFEVMDGFSHGYALFYDVLDDGHEPIHRITDFVNSIVYTE